MSGEEKQQCVISRSSSSPTLCKIIMWDSRIGGVKSALSKQQMHGLNFVLHSPHSEMQSK